MANSRFQTGDPAPHELPTPFCAVPHVAAWRPLWPPEPLNGVNSATVDWECENTFSDAT
jgi:hypothetical protein